ncbi:MAG TPA: DUF6483 family protein [Desulfosporosinus sp.]
MFEEKDYFMNMIKQFAEAIGKIMGLKAENKIEESQAVLSETFKYFTDLNKEVIEALPYEILIHKVSGSGQMNSEKRLMLAELLAQQADIYEAKGEKPRARNLYLKSLNILLDALLNDDNVASEENMNKVNELIDKIGWINISNQSKILLFQYYELAKSYAKAEDVLFNLIETNEANKDILLKGIAFYERLSEIDHAELEKANLPIDEVLEGLTNLKGYRNGVS